MFSKLLFTLLCEKKKKFSYVIIFFGQFSTEALVNVLPGGIVEEGVEADPGMAVEKECRICSEQTDLMTFHPCQHKLVCKACCIRYFS